MRARLILITFSLWTNLSSGSEVLRAAALNTVSIKTCYLDAQGLFKHLDATGAAVTIDLEQAKSDPACPKLNDYSKADAAYAEEAFVEASPQFFYIFKFLTMSSWREGILTESRKLSPDDQSAHAFRIRNYAQMINASNEKGLSSSALREVLILEAELDLPAIYNTVPLTKLEGLAIFNYGTEAYRSINPALWSGQPSPQARAYKDFLNRALDKLPAFQGVVKRSVPLSDSALQEMTVGNVVSFPSFSSATVDLNLSIFETIHRLIIHSKSGRDISKLTSHPNEHEVLFKAGSTFKILRRTENVTLAGNTARVEIELEEL